MDVDPVASVKRKAATASLDMCFICQSKKKGAIRNGSDEGKRRLQEVSEICRKLHDVASIEIIDRIQSVPPATLTDLSVFLHKSCHSSFTSQDKIKRLKSNVDLETPETSETALEKPSTRRSLQPVDWSLCIFCQTGTAKDPYIRNIRELPTSENILNLARNDKVMRIRLAGVNDLHAADGKYHLKCLSKFKRQCKSSKAKTEADDFVMTDMCLTIEKGLSRGHVYDINDV